YLEAPDTALLFERVNPSGPAQLFGTRFFDNHIVKNEVAVTAQSLGKGQQQRHEGSTREGHLTCQAIERIVTASRQEARQACLRRPRIKQDQASHDKRNQCSQRGRTQTGKLQSQQCSFNRHKQVVRGTIQARRHRRNLPSVNWLYDSSSLPKDGVSCFVNVQAVSHPTA